MWTWKKSDTDKLDKEKLFQAFPSSLRRDVEKVIAVLPLDKNVQLCDGQIHKIDDLIHSNEQIVFLNEELLKIPSRVYFNEPQLHTEKVLTNLQKAILNCIYLRHHNGFVRQKRLGQLIDTTDYFVIPYTFQLLGEYVIEILEVLDRHLNANTVDNYIKFINENKRYWQQTESRMISYWNEYYRRPKFLKLNDYIGKQIVDRIKANAQHELCKKPNKKT